MARCHPNEICMLLALGFFLSLAYFFPFSVLISASLFLCLWLLRFPLLCLILVCSMALRAFSFDWLSFSLIHFIPFLLLLFYLKHYFCARCDIHFSMFNSIVMWNLRSYTHIHRQIHIHVFIYECMCMCMYSYHFLLWSSFSGHVKIYTTHSHFKVN